MRRGLSYLPDHWWFNRVTCAARSALYWQERTRLEYIARRDEWKYKAYQRPLVSVLIPTHNRVKLLTERCLPSVFAQTYPNLEIIVAVHGTREQYFEALDAIPFKLFPVSRVHYIHVPRTRTYPPTAENHWFAGPVAPLNAALKVATGLWLARIDDDDEWEPTHIERLLRFAQLNDLEFASAAHKEERDGKTYTVSPYNVNGIRVGGTQTWLWRSYLKFMAYNPSCWRKKHDRVNDTDLQRRFVNAGVRMGYLNEIHAYVKPRPGERTVGLKAYTADPEKTERAFAFK